MGSKIEFSLTERKEVIPDLPPTTHWKGRLVRVIAVGCIIGLLVLGSPVAAAIGVIAFAIIHYKAQKSRIEIALDKIEIEPDLKPWDRTEHDAIWQADETAHEVNFKEYGSLEGVVTSRIMFPEVKDSPRFQGFDIFEDYFTSGLSTLK